MILLPHITLLLLTTVFSVFLISLISINKKDSFNECISLATKTQQIRINATSKIVKLNKKASALRLQRQTAEIVYYSAPPQAKPTAKAALEAVKISQKTFHKYQKALILQASIKIKKHFYEIFLKKYTPSKFTLRMHLTSYPKNSDSPSYRPSESYSSKTEVKLIKKRSLMGLRKFRLEKMFPDFFKKLIYFEKCGAHIKTKGDSLSKIKLIPDK